MDTEKIEPKYECTGETKVFHGATLRRIRALRDIPLHGVKAGDLGGWIENAGAPIRAGRNGRVPFVDQGNLAQDGECWIGGDSMAYGRAMVMDDALLGGQSIASGSAAICGRSRCVGRHSVRGACAILENAEIVGAVTMDGNVRVQGNAKISGACSIAGYSFFTDNVNICFDKIGSTLICVTAKENAHISGNLYLQGANFRGDAIVEKPGDVIVVTTGHSASSMYGSGTTVTAFRDSSCGVRVNAMSFSGPLDQFRAWSVDLAEVEHRRLDQFRDPAFPPFVAIADLFYAGFGLPTPAQSALAAVAQKLVDCADSDPFTTVGHLVEHIAPEVRDVASPSQRQVDQGTGICPGGI